MRFPYATVFALSLARLTASHSIEERDADVAFENKWKGHSAIQPFQQTLPASRAGELQKRFKPWLSADSGCFPYAAVDGEGYHGGGLRPTGKSRSGCRDGGNRGGQVYSRVGTSNGRTGILYTWYIPKVQSKERHRHFYLSTVVWVYTEVCDAAANATNFEPAGLTYSTGSDVAAWDKTQPRAAIYTVGDDGTGITHPVVGYDGGVNLFPVQDKNEWDISNPLIDWDELPDLAKAQFNGVVYEWARCPFTDANFQATMDAAYADSVYGGIAADPGADCGSATTPTTTLPNDDPVESGASGTNSTIPADPTFTPTP